MSDFSKRELPTVTAYELYITAGFNAVIGFPLPSGYLPVGLRIWGSYRRILMMCAPTGRCVRLNGLQTLR